MLSPTYKIFFSLLLLLLGNSIKAQVGNDSILLHLETLGIQQGLSQGMVRSIVQDQNGFMWFATKDGLNRYDGYHIKIYRNNVADSTSLADNYITQIAEDALGNFWIGTASKGIFLFDKKTETFFPITVKGNMSQQNIYVIKSHKRGLLIATLDEIFFIDIEQLKSIQHNPRKKMLLPTLDFNKQQGIKNLNDANATFSGLMDNGDIWIRNKDTLFICKAIVHQSKWMIQKKYLPEMGFSKAGFVFYSAELKTPNTYFIKTEFYVAIYDALANKIKYLQETFSNNDINPPLIAPSGNLLLMYKNNSYEFNPHTLQWKRIIQNTNAEYILGMCCTKDKTGILWIGTGGYGIIKYDERKQNFHSSTQKVTPVARNIYGNAIFIHQKIAQVLDVQSNKFSEILPKGYLAKRNWQVTFVTQDVNGLYWMKGAELKTDKRFILSYNENTNAIHEYFIINKFPKQFESLFIDKQNNVWMIYMHQDHHWRLRKLNTEKDTIANEFSFPVINNMLEYQFVSDWWQDKNNKLWFGTTQGLFCLDYNKNIWHQYSNTPDDSTSLSSNIIFSLCADPIAPQKYLWIGTNGGGLNKFDLNTNTCQRYLELHGLPNNVVYGILPDEKNNLWLSTNKGISCFAVATNTFLNFGQKDGLVSDEFNRYEYQKLADGQLLFGGINGYTIFQPRNVLTETQPPTIVLTSLTVFNNEINFKTNPKIINAPIEYASTITLSHEQNMFSIEFAGLDFANIETNKYKYILEGFNENWIDNGKNNIANFTNLDAGEYIFKVTGCNASGVCNLKFATIKIIVLPPWWGTWWFRALMLLALAVILYLIYRYRLSKAIEMHKLRNSIASDLHDEIGSTLSSISLSSTIIQNKMKNSNTEVNGLLDQISSNTNDMMEAMSDIVWSINTKNDSFDTITNRIRAFAFEILEPKNCSVHFDIDEKLKHKKMDMRQRKNIYLIAKECINNIAKYASCSHVWITIKYINNKKILLSIKDNGKGFSVNTSESKSHNFGGNGLGNMYNRAKEMHAILTINSQIGEGTEVRLELET